MKINVIFKKIRLIVTKYIKMKIMLKNILSLALLLFSIPIFSQVGINTTTPNAQLEIKSSNEATPAITDGIIIPKINAFPTVNPTAEQQGMMVFLTTTVGTKVPGFYYWDNSTATWIGVGSNTANAWGLTGNAGTTAGTNFIGSTDDVDLVFKRNNVLAGKLAINNTSIGINSLYSNSTGLSNTSMGSNALYSNTTGGSNTANGYNSLFSNTTGNFNTANGISSLYSNTTGRNNTAKGAYGLFSNTIGNYNTANGSLSLYFNNTGSYNAANGAYSLYSNTTGGYNSANGAYSLYFNTTGGSNTANGYNSLFFNTAGYYNTANGNSSLYNNSTGYQNTANGGSSLYSNTTGINNTANGYNSLFSNTTGGYNTTNGAYSLYFNTTGSSNTANGYYSLFSNTTGTNNTAFGLYAGYGGVAITTGWNNTFIGYNASSDSAIRINSIAIAGNGNLAFGGDNRVRIGNNVMTSIGGQVAWTTISDQRVKQNIQQDVKGLDFILKLKPVTYNYSIEKSNQIQKSTIADVWPSKNNIEKIRFSGFLAQEVEKTAQEVGYDFSGVDKPEDVDGLWGLRYSEFTVPLVKAVQELNAQNIEAKEAIVNLKNQLNELLQIVTEQREKIQLLEKK
ncbi:MAG: hypothetical protein RL607_1417 [Bacteroidota bacterium]|jgi:hypothetical protein